MTPLHGLAIAAAGVVAGMVNTIVGSGSLLTFPTLLALGYPPVVANVSNGIGLVPGSLSGAYGYRRELAGQGRRILTLVPAAVVGSLVGGVLLLELPGSVFRHVVPVLILLAVALVLVQPSLARRRAATGRAGRTEPGAGLQVGTFGTAVYGGYFGAAQGVLLIALLGLSLDDDLQRLNGVKNVIAAVNNGVAAVLFIATTTVAWGAAGLLCVGSIIGGQLGALVGRRIPPRVLRTVIVVVGTGVAIELLVTQ